MSLSAFPSIANLDWEAVATAFLVVATVVLVCVTAWYNQKIVREAIAMRWAEFKPIIYVTHWTESLEGAGPGNQWFQFYLQNVGRGPAFNIEIAIDGIKPETVAKGVKGYPQDCLAANHKSSLIRIIYGNEEIATRRYEEPSLVVRYRDMGGYLIESRRRLIQKELRLTSHDPPFYFVHSAPEFVVKDV